MTAPLTPHEILADLKALARIEADWNADGRLDGYAEDDINNKRADLMDSLREGLETWEDVEGTWHAATGVFDLETPVGTGKTEIEAIEDLLERIGEEV